MKYFRSPHENLISVIFTLTKIEFHYRGGGGRTSNLHAVVTKPLTSYSHKCEMEHARFSHRTRPGKERGGGGGGGRGRGTSMYVRARRLVPRGQRIGSAVVVDVVGD